MTEPAGKGEQVPTVGCCSPTVGCCSPAPSSAGTAAGCCPPRPPSVAAEVTVEAAVPEDLPALQTLLREAGLPADIEAHLADVLIARHGGRPVGCVGMEALGSVALFRSLAVTPAYRGLGLAARLYEALEARARARGVSQVWLLTASIQPLAERWGFRVMDRSHAPAAIALTTEFRGACCATAVAMRKDVDPCPG